MRNYLRKFGLRHHDLPTMVSNVADLLRVLTINIDSRDNEHISILFYALTVLLSVTVFYSQLVSMLWYVFYRSRQTGDTLPAIIVFSLGTASQIAGVKLINIFLYKHSLKEIVHECLIIDTQVVKHSRFYYNLKKTLKIVKKRAITYWIVINLNGIIYIIKPLLLPGRHLMEDAQVLVGLEPMFESPNYEIAFFIEAIAAIFICYVPATTSALLILITGYIEAQILALSEELLYSWDDAQNYYANEYIKDISANKNSTNRASLKHNRSKIVNEHLKNKFEKIIKSHARNINILKRLEISYTGVIGVEFGLLSIGLIAELLGGLENTYLQLPFALIQVSMDCLIGQKIIDASTQFERAVYDCNWQNFDVNNRRIILLILINSQKSLTLSAGGITMLSFTCLMSVLKTIYSAYTTLRTTMN